MQRTRCVLRLLSPASRVWEIILPSMSEEALETSQEYGYCASDTLMEHFLGIDIGGTKCAVVVGNERGDVLARKSFMTNTEQPVDKDISSIIKAIHDLTNMHRDAVIRAVGISCGGPLDTVTGVIMSPPNLSHWNGIPIVSIIRDEVGVETFLMNDADASALAEWRFGAGRGFSNIVFLTFGTGIGAGLILDNRLYSGTNGLAGEVGHIRLAEEGPLGHGKNGSFEGFCSGGGIARMGAALARKRFSMGKTVSFCSDIQLVDQITAKEISEAAQAGNQDALSIFHTAAEYLGKGIAILIDILNPQRVIVGSIYGRMESVIRPAMEAAVRREALERSAISCRIVPAALGEHIGDKASIAVAMYQTDKEVFMQSIQLSSDS